LYYSDIRLSDTDKSSAEQFANERMSENTVSDALRALWAHKPPTITEAVKALRIALGCTQQEFAQRLGLAISTVVRYESTRAPRGEALAKLVRLANDSGLVHIAEMFRYAINSDAGLKVETRETGQAPDADDLTEAIVRAVDRVGGDVIGLKLPKWAYRLTRLELALRKEHVNPTAKIDHALKEVSEIWRDIRISLLEFAASRSVPPADASDAADAVDATTQEELLAIFRAKFQQYRGILPHWQVRAKFLAEHTKLLDRFYRDCLLAAEAGIKFNPAEHRHFLEQMHEESALGPATSERVASDKPASQQKGANRK
jgi:transcriptional regulator with XRE-family HTH domain